MHPPSNRAKATHANLDDAILAPALTAPFAAP